MAPLNPNNTARLKVFYQNIIAEHVAVIRLEGTGAIEDAKSGFLDIVTALSGAFHFSEITALQFSAEGTDLFFDIEGTGFVGVTWGSDPCDPEHNALAASFVGRSGLGRRSRFFLFGWKADISDYRQTVTESAAVGDAIAVLNASETSFLAIDGQPVIWKNYVNIKPNDHWVGQARGS